MEGEGGRGEVGGLERGRGKKEWRGSVMEDEGAGGEVDGLGTERG